MNNERKTVKNCMIKANENGFTGKIEATSDEIQLECTEGFLRL